MSPDAPTPDSQPTSDAHLVGDRYQLLDKLGEGGMGAVFRGRDTKLDRAVAVKMLPPGSAPDAGAVARFRREAKALARLSHPGIIQAYDSGEEGGRPFLVMELVEGRSLAAVLREQGRLSPARAADFAYQAALALHHAHKSGLIHRDVKPGNLLLSADGRLRLLDLGLARFLQDQIGDASLTREGTGLGTPDYCPPEQFSDAHHADPRADVYSLGCTLYHLVAGRVPFPGSSFSEKVEAHERKEPAPLEEVCPEVPAGLALTVRRMMAKRPADRFQSMAEVGEALMPHVAGSSASFPHIRQTATWDGSRLATMPVLPRRRRVGTLVAAGAALALVLAAGIVVTLGSAAGWFRPPESPIAQGGDPRSTETEKQPPAPADTGQAPQPEAQNKEPARFVDDPNVLAVSQEEKDGGKYRTINAALDKVRPGQTIRVLDDGVYHELLAINSLTQHRGITLEAPRHATLESAGERAISILIQGVPGVTVRGFHLRSAAKSTAYLVGVVGKAPGTVVEQLDLEGGQTAVLFGVEVEQLALADGDPPLIVQDCLFRQVGVGIRLSGLKNDYRTADPNRRVMVRNNRFARCHVPVVLRGEFRDVFVVGNLIWNASGTGILLENVLAGAGNLLIANNTLLECGQSVLLRDDKDKKSWGDGIRVSNNLILGTSSEDVTFLDTGGDPDEVRGDGDGDALRKSWRFDHNGREWRPAAGKTPARSWIPPAPDDIAADRLKVRSRDPAESGFLRPDPKSPLATAGAGNEDPSLPPYAGALPPEGTDPWDWDRAWRMPKGAQLLTVSKDSKDGGTYRTINDALRRAKSWTTVRVLDAEAYEETVILDSKEKHEGLTLEAPRGATILLGGGARQALVIRDVPRVNVRGFRIGQAEGQKAAAIRKLVQVNGHCPGLKLESLDLRPSFMAMAASLEGVSGLPDEPVSLTRCRVDGGGGNVDGIILAGSMDPEAAPSRAAIVRDNRVTGVLQGIHVQGALADVQVAGNLIFGCRQEAIGLSDLTPKAERLLLANNTLFNSSYGVRGWVDKSYHVNPGQVEFRNNLVLAHDLADMTVMVGSMGQGMPSVEECKAAAAAWRFGGNWRDLGGTAHLIPLAPGDSRLDDISLLPRDSTSADFLRPPAKSPLAAAGAGKEDPSLPVYVGALPPEGAPAWDWDRTWRARVKKAEVQK